MKSTFVKNIIFAMALSGVIGMASCKNNDAREGEMTGPDGIEAEPMGTTATKEAADTTSRAEEDSLIETPSP